MNARTRRLPHRSLLLRDANGPRERVKGSGWGGEFTKPSVFPNNIWMSRYPEMTRNAYKTDFLYTVKNLIVLSATDVENTLSGASWGFKVLRWPDGFIQKHISWLTCFWFISGATPPKFEYNKDLEKWLTTAVLDKDEGLLLLILLVALFLGTNNETMNSFWISENELLGSRLEPINPA